MPVSNFNSNRTCRQILIKWHNIKFGENPFIHFRAVTHIQMDTEADKQVNRLILANFTVRCPEVHEPSVEVITK
jgi:hypothetical protein